MAIRLTSAISGSSSTNQRSKSNSVTQIIREKVTRARSHEFNLLIEELLFSRLRSTSMMAGTRTLQATSSTTAIRGPVSQRLLRGNRLCLASIHPTRTSKRSATYEARVTNSLYSDGRFYDLENDLHERQPIPPGDGSPDAEQARTALQKALAHFPKKKQ